jgi:long-chain acyl-CoA synthetase
MNNLFTYFESATERHGTRLAIEFRPRFRTLRWTYRDLAERMRNLSGALAGLGLVPGDRVLLYSGSSPYWVAAYFAVLGRGAVVVPLNPHSTPAQLDRIVASATPKVALVSARLTWRPSLPCVEIERAAHKEVEAVPLPGRGGDPGELAEIVYTSGTTGDPKGVMLTHANLLANIEMVGRTVPLAPTDHILTIVPLFHMYAQMTSMLYPLQWGCAVTYLLAPSSRLILDTLAHTPVTHIVAVPEFLKTVMGRIEERVRRLPRPVRTLLVPLIRARLSRTLHTIVSGGAALDPEVERKWLDLGFTILQGYGLTETAPVIASNTASVHRLGSVGKPCEGLQVRIAADGEILVKGPNVMAGYFRDERRTRESFEDGWLKTDDGGRLDADGFLYVYGRKKYVILGPTGENVFPEDIETELNKVTGVRDSAVFGLERGGRTVVHAVMLCDGCDGDAVVEQANGQLAPHQQIMSWSIWPEPDFPRSATRKPKKEEIMAWVRGREQVRPAAAAAATPLVRLLAQVTHHDPATIHPASRIVGDLGLDSLMRIELVSCIEEELNVAVDENYITPQTTVADLETQITAQAARAPVLTKYPRWSLSPWANRLRPLVRGVLISSWIRLVCRLKVSGVEHLETVDGPVIFMANHRSFLDSPATVMAIPRRLRHRLAIAAATGVLYERFRWVVPLADLAYNSYPFPTEVFENIKTGLEYTGRLLDDSWNVLIFPEGRMRRDDAAPLLALKGGAGVLAVEMQVPVVPVVIVGTDRIIPPDRLVPRRVGIVQVRFGPPILVDAAESYLVAAQRIEEAMRALLAREEGSRSLGAVNSA